MEESIFKNLKPVQAKLFIQPNTKLVELLKLTFADLIFSQVLVVKKKNLKLHPNHRYERKYTFVETGNGFKNHSSKSYETYFTDLLDEESHFLFKPFLNKVYENVHSRYDFAVKVISSEQQKSNFDLNYFYYLFSRIVRKSKGKELGINLKKILDQIDISIKDDIKDDPEKIAKTLRDLGSNIFLLKNLDLEWLNDFDFFKSNSNNYQILDDYSWLQEQDWDNDFTSVFDSLEDNFGSSSDYEIDFDL